MSAILGSSKILRAPLYAWDFADGLRLYQGATGSGRWNLGTLRLTGTLLGLPDAVQKIICCHEAPGLLYGFRICTGNVAGAISAYVGGSGGYVETARYTFVAGDVGKSFVLHLTVDTVARLFIGGAEVGTGTAAVTITTPGPTGRLTIGQYVGGGFVNPFIGVRCLSISPTTLTPAEVAADAMAHMSRSRGGTYPLLPGEDQRHLAEDIADASTWRDHLGSYHLTETGDVKVTRVSL